MANNVHNDITQAIRSTVLALIWGFAFGINGLGFSLRPLNTALIFGGIGMFFAYTLKIHLLLLTIHCVYAFLIIRFRFRGIITVVIFHYSSVIIGLIVWTSFALPPDIWEEFRMFYAAYFDPHPIHYEPLYKLGGPIGVAMIVLPSTAYNGFLLSLLSSRVRKMLSLS